MAAKSMVCDHLDSDTNELTFPRFGLEEVRSKWSAPDSICQRCNLFCGRHTAVSFMLLRQRNLRTCDMPLMWGLSSRVESAFPQRWYNWHVTCQQRSTTYWQ